MNSKRSTTNICSSLPTPNDRLRAIVLAWTALIALACTPADDAPANEPAADGIPEDVLLTSFIDASKDSVEVLSGHSVHGVSWTMSGDTQTAIFQHPPSVLVVREPLRGDRCTFRFAIGLKPEAWGPSDGVTFRVALETAEGRIELFKTFFDPSQHVAPSWMDHEIELPRTAGRLILETGIGPQDSANSDWAAWAAPQLDCYAKISVFPPPPSPHVVLISLDTLRLDHLGTYGYGVPTSPTLDALARESVVFDNAFAVAPFTLPTHASMFTGLYPDQHLAGHHAPFIPLDDSATTLAERLRGAGYRTIAFTAGGIMNRENGLAQGFDVWNEKTRVNLGAELPRIFAELGAGSAQPTFLFVHTYDIHGPYPDLRDEPSPAVDSGDNEWQRIRSIGGHRYLDLERYSGIEDVRRAYDEGIRRTDANLELLFSHLRRIGIWDHALVIATSDHGETLYDRTQYIGHTYTLYDEIIRVPLIIKSPGTGLRGRNDDLVDQTDILPTVIGFLGLDPEPGLSGADIFARASGAEPKREMVRGEAPHTGARFARTKNWKAISSAYPLGDPRSRLPAGLGDRFFFEPQIFEVDRDRGEHENLASTGNLDRAGSTLLNAALKAEMPGEFVGDTAPDGDMVDQLRALGYVE